ncbi:MAG: chalcone isomerase family protein [Anaeromyxobacter sp.]|nr:chalcone isomerase family protein [Anaeromyxobacter sp.]MBL0278666.1 chalcone isomerase family protein [Anaeromyxobacter sp.]
MAVAVVLAAPPARAGASTLRVDEVAFDREVEVGGQRLGLAGAGLFRWKWFVKVYAAAHYLPAGLAQPGPESDAPRRLEFSYLVAIERDGFGRAADELLARHLAPAALAPLRSRLERLHAAYVDVVPGDRYALTYVPGRGTELTHNGRSLALVEGADFARAYFGIWLGPAPIDDGLRQRLLGR